MTNFEEWCTTAQPLVFAALRSAKRPLAGIEIAKKTGLPAGRVLYALHTVWKEEIIIVTDIPHTYTLG